MQLQPLKARQTTICSRSKQFSAPPSVRAGLHSCRPKPHNSSCHKPPTFICNAAATSSSLEDTDIASKPSACPFAAAVGSSKRSQPGSQLSAAELAALQGPGWAALVNGNTANLTQPEGKRSWNPLQFVMGDFSELLQGEVPFLLERLRLFGPVFKWKFGSDTVIGVCEYDTIKSLLQHDGKVMTFWAPPGLQAIGSKAGNKAMANPAARMAQRKTLAPGFSRQALRQVIGKVESICRRHLQQWAAAEGAIDLAVEGRQLAFDFSTHLLVNFDLPEAQRAQVKSQLDDMFKAMMAPPVNLPGTTFRKGIEAKAQLLADIKQVIRQSDASSSDGASAFELSLKSHRANQGGAELTEDTIAESGISLLLAGTDTSGGGSTAALAMLAQFPQVMQRLRQEQQQVIAEHGPGLSLAAVDDMPYADAVVKEALRLAPPAGAMMRRTLVDLQIGGKFVPAGSLLYLSTFVAANFADTSLHASGLASLSPQDLSGLAKSWKHVNHTLLQSEFKPERWLKGEAEDGKVRKSSGLLTFGSGLHVCLGMTLFMVEAKVLLALLAREYDMTAVQPQELKFDQLMAAQLQRNAGSCVRVTKLEVPAAAAAAVV